MEIDTFNRCMVTSHAGGVLVARPLPKLTSKEAIEFAAWLVAMADVNASMKTGPEVTEDEMAISDDAAGVFAKALEAVRNT